MTALTAPSSHPIEARVCFVPYHKQGINPPLPTAASWRFLKENCNVTGVRLQYLYDDPTLWPDAFAAAYHGGMEVHGNFCVTDMSKSPTPTNIEDRAYGWMIDNLGWRMTSVSFGNEPGYTFGPDDVSGGGSRDYMKEYVENFYLPFVRGVRRANPDIVIAGPDAESADILQRFVDLVDVDQWLVHPYGEPELSEGDGLDYATMAGKNEKPGFLDVRKGSGPRPPLIISEISHEEHASAKARGQFGRLIATDEEIDQLTAFSARMRDEFHAPVITLLQPEYFFTRVPVVLQWPPPDPPKDPPDTWSTFAYGTPELSEAGKRLAAVFAPMKPAQGRPPGKGRRG